MKAAALRVLLVVAALLVAVAALEGAAAAYRRFACPGDPPGFSVPDARFGWMHVPSSSGQAWACRGSAYEFSRTASFNARGLSDDDIPLERRAGVARVLVLGDSVTEALQVDRAGNFTSILEAGLARDGRPVEVVNAGHAGFGTDNEVLFFEREGRLYRPDVVVLAFNLQNDLAENSPEIVARMYAGGPPHPKAGMRLLPGGGIELDDAPYAQAVAEWNARPWWRRDLAQGWMARSFLVRRVARALARPATVAKAAEPWPPQLGVYATPPDADWLRSRELTAALLRRLRDDVGADGAKLLVVVVPSREVAFPADWANLVTWFPALARGSWDLQQPRLWLLSTLAAEGIASVDATDAFRRGREATGQAGFLEQDPHPDALGHAWIADALGPALEAALAEAKAPAHGLAPAPVASTDDR